MRMLADIESNFATGVQLDFEIAGMADSFDSGEFSVSNLQFPRRGRELNAVALRDVALNFLVLRHPRQPSWIVGLSSSILALDGYAVFAGVHSIHSRVFARVNPQNPTPSGIAHQVPLRVLRGPLPICAGHLISRIEDSKFVFLWIHVATGLQFTVDQIVQLASRLIVR